MKTVSFIALLVLTQAACALGAGAPVWRFWSPVLSRHFYTISAAERDLVQRAYADVWRYEGCGYNAYASPEVEGLEPVHRFWSDRLGAHFYTIDEAEKDLVAGAYTHTWTYEGIVFYAWPDGSQPAGTLPVYRFWSDRLQTHFYTASDPEKFMVANNGAGVWTYEGVAWYAWPADSAAPTTIVKGPYLQGPSANAITVMWETNVATASRVDYGTASVAESFVENTTPVLLHKIELSGLAADTSYVYRVTSGEAVSEVGNFVTAPSAGRSFRFVVYGDSRSFPETHAQVVQGILDSGPEFVLHTGDIVSIGREHTLWDSEFFAPTRQMLLTTPMVPVPGNHEYNGTGPLWYFYYFDRPYGTPWFAMTYGNTRLVGLDTDLSLAPGSPQQEWLLEELTSAAWANATWRIVVFHHPPFTATAGHSDNPTVVSQLVPLLESYGADIAFQGHSHAYERYRHNGVHYIVTGGGGGPLYDLVPDVTPPVRLAGRSAYHHCIIDINIPAGTLTVAAIDTDGQTFDALELQQ